MTLTFHANGKIDGINNANFNSSLPSGHIIQTVTSLIGSSSTGGFGISSSDINNPTLYELLPSGKVKAHHCQSEDKSSNV